MNRKVTARLPRKDSLLFHFVHRQISLVCRARVTIPRRIIALTEIRYRIFSQLWDDASWGRETERILPLSVWPNSGRNKNIAKPQSRQPNIRSYREVCFCLLSS